MITKLENVKGFIREYGSMTELADKSGLNRTMLYKILSGDRMPGMKTLEGLITAGMKKEDIF